MDVFPYYITFNGGRQELACHLYYPIPWLLTNALNEFLYGTITFFAFAISLRKMIKDLKKNYGNSNVERAKRVRA